MKTIGVITLALLAIGCGSTPITIHDPVEVEITKTKYVPVPESLLSPCTVPLDNLDINADLEAALAAAVVELDRCTGDKDAIRELKDAGPTS